MAERGADPVDNLKYVSDMLDQLRVLAAESGGPFLPYLIDMARTEALDQIRAMRKGGAASSEP